MNPQDFIKELEAIRNDFGRKMAALKADMEKMAALKADMEKTTEAEEPAPPFKVGDRVTCPSIEVKAAKIERMEGDRDAWIAHGHGWSYAASGPIASVIRLATPEEIALAEYGLRVGDWVKYTKGDPFSIKDFTLDAGKLFALANDGTGDRYACDKLTKVPAPEPAWTLERLRREFPVGRKVRHAFDSGEGVVTRHKILGGYGPAVYHRITKEDDGTGVGHETFTGPKGLTLLPPEPAVPEWLTPGAEVLVRVTVVSGKGTPMGNIEAICRQNGIGEFHSWFRPEDILPAGAIVLGAPGGKLEQGQRVMVAGEVADDRPNSVGQTHVRTEGGPVHPDEDRFCARDYVIYPIISGGKP